MKSLVTIHKRIYDITETDDWMDSEYNGTKKTTASRGIGEPVPFFDGYERNHIAMQLLF